MKVTELRIGNYIIDNYDGLLTKVTQLEIDETHPDWVDVDASPVPLTEEWLVKFGFKNGYKGTIHIKESETVMQGKFKGKWTITLLASAPYALDRKIEYVHQLQNLYFALTGEELTLKES